MHTFIILTNVVPRFMKRQMLFLLDAFNVTYNSKIQQDTSWHNVKVVQLPSFIPMIHSLCHLQEVM